MKISVVILNWNRPQDTIAAVDSVLKQNYADFDVLVWDNASSDNSLQILKQNFAQEPRIQIHASPRNDGVAGGRNRAFRRTTGEIIFSLDSDAIIEESDALKKIAEQFQQDTLLGALSFEVKRPDGHLMWPFSRPAKEWCTKTFETFRVDGCSFAVRRTIFDEVHGFAEHFSPYGAEDAHFAFKVIGQGYRIMYMPTVGVIHASSPQGRNRRQFMMHVRNSLFIPLELFPMPYGIVSHAKSALNLLKDAHEQNRLGAFIVGFVRSLTDFRISHRFPMKPSAWRRFRDLVRNEKLLGA